MPRDGNQNYKTTKSFYFAVVLRFKKSNNTHQNEKKAQRAMINCDLLEKM
jgi:hypothetical protein